MTGPEAGTGRGPGALCFAVEGRDGAARAGRLTLTGIEVETPIFMPVGTRACVRTLTCEDLETLGYKLVLGNTFHLMLRPGGDLLESFGGLHRFWSWSGRILTDSGGFQVFSLAKLAKRDEDGVEFASPLDGSRHKLTPERSIDLQVQFGSDIVMAFDECLSWPLTHPETERLTRRSLAWTRRSHARFLERKKPHQSFFGILQGGGYDDLRRASGEEIVAMGCDGYAIGGLAIGEPKEMMRHQVEVAAGVLPPDRPRYLMGVGTPDDLLHAIERGVDMFDCVLPTRAGRHDRVYTFAEGELNLRNARFRTDGNPVEADCPCLACRRYSRAYLHHLGKCGEETVKRLATIHNLMHYRRLVDRVRAAILAGRFAALAAELRARWPRKGGAGA